MTHPASIPLNEDERIAKLVSYDILDTDFEDAFDRITSLVAELYEAPICLVSLVDTDRQWFKSACGLPVRETERDIAFCSHAILGDEVFYIEDATKDARFHQNPLVTSEPSIRTYCGAPLLTVDGYRLGTLCIIYDRVHPLSDKDFKQLEKFAAIVVDEMELRIAIKYSESTRRTAEHEAKSKEIFLANMSHEIRTPMAGIVGLVDFLLDTNLSLEQKGKVNAIKNQADLMTAVLNDILDHSKILEGKLSIVPQVIVVHDIVKQSFELFSQKASVKQLDYGCIIDDDVPEKMVTDPTRLNQILNNLLSNAIKYTSAGHVTLHVYMDDQDLIKFSVSDQGTGIPEDKQKLIFQRFKQLDGELAVSDQGSGLGLSICTELVALLSGEIGLDSQKAIGSKFWFTLPIGHCEDGHEIDGFDHQASDVTMDCFKDCKPKDILIAEDNHINQLIIQRLLQPCNFTITMVNNGEAAYEHVKKHHYDLILMDVRMPIMDGIESTKRIRALADKSKSSIPIIAITADVTADNRQRYLQAGVNAVITKPIDAPILAKQMKATLS